MWFDKSVLSRAMTSPKKQLESLSVSSLIQKQPQPHQEIQETIPTYTKAATTSPPTYSSCLMKIAYMPNVDGGMWRLKPEQYNTTMSTNWQLTSLGCAEPPNEVTDGQRTQVKN
ncbi:hypothetical protein YC2023_066700 [Brassica napus]